MKNIERYAQRSAPKYETYDLGENRNPSNAKGEFLD